MLQPFRALRLVSVALGGVVGLLAAQVFAYEQPLGTPEHGLQAEIAVQRETFGNSDSIDVTVSLRNISAAPVEIDPWPGNWFVQVYDEQVNVIGPKSRVSDVFRPLPEPVSLKPGEAWTLEIKSLQLTSALPGSTPDWEYEPLKPGIYWLGAEYTVLADTRHPKMWVGRLTSKLVKIVVRAEASNKSGAQITEHPATSTETPTLQQTLTPELVKQAELIFVGTVTRVEPLPAECGVLMTWQRVHFSVRELLKETLGEPEDTKDVVVHYQCGAPKSIRRGDQLIVICGRKTHPGMSPLLENVKTLEVSQRNLQSIRAVLTIQSDKPESSKLYDKTQ